MHVNDPCDDCKRHSMGPIARLRLASSRGVRRRKGQSGQVGKVELEGTPIFPGPAKFSPRVTSDGLPR